MTCLAVFCNKITNLVKEKGIGDSVYLEIKQAFDTIFCNTLIMDKLRKYKLE